MAVRPVPQEITQALQQFLELVGEIRPQLHRYGARMTGSITEGEQVVQDTLAKTFYALGTLDALPNLHSWLFRVAHSAAIGFIQRHQRGPVELHADSLQGAEPVWDDAIDPDTARTALKTFLMLPPMQRSAVILKDVMGQSAAEVAKTMGTDLTAVTEAVSRGRERLRVERSTKIDPVASCGATPVHPLIEQFVSLFNHGEWESLGALLVEDVRLDLVSMATRRGPTVRYHLASYAEKDARLGPGSLEERPVLWVFCPRVSCRPKYFIEVTHDSHRVTHIRDFEHVAYIAKEIELAPHHIADA